jgi:hypothetical protein
VSENLAVISGVVTALVIHAGKEEFVRSLSNQVVGTGAAAGLAAAGLAGAAAGASLSAVSPGDSVEFFECKVGGQTVRGRFSKVSFREGDQLTLVASETHGQLLALAARRAIDQTIWMVPHGSRGRRAHAALSGRLCVRLLLTFLVGGFSFVAFMPRLGYAGKGDPLDWFSMSIVGGMSVLVAPYFSIRFYRQWLPIARQTEHIFSALGYPTPSHVDLPRDHERYCKAHGIKWPYLTDGPWIYHYLDAHRPAPDNTVQKSC